MYGFYIYYYWVTPLQPAYKNMYGLYGVHMYVDVS